MANEKNSANELTYIGAKCVVAWPEERDGKPGFAVRYLDGYTSWSPAEPFQASYVVIDANEAPLRLACMLEVAVGTVVCVAPEKLEELAEAERRVAELEGQLADRGIELDNVQAQLRAKTEDLTKVQGKLDRAERKVKSAAKSVPRESAGKARKVAELEKPMVRAAFEEIMDSAREKPLELVFSDGKREILEIDPLEVWPAGFRRAGARRALIAAPHVKGTVNPSLRVRGVGLLLDGEQIAWCPFPDPVEVPLGGEVKFDRMIAF